MVGIVLTAYEAELQNIEHDIRALGPEALGPPIDLENATKYAYRLYQHASLNGDLTGFREAEHAIDTVAAQVQRPDDLLLLKANLCLKLHRNNCVRRILESRPELQDTDEGMKLLGDLRFYDGQYAEARATYELAIEKNRSWDTLARYAHYIAKFEGADRADEVYAEAEDEVTSKQMRSFAWLELQRGVLDLERGRFEDARVHYDRADRAYPGYWMVDEHRAALLAREGDHRGAAELYRSLAERVPKPELLQTLGDLYRLIGFVDTAQPYYDRALAAFEESVQRSEVHYYHHLVDFHCTVTRNTPEAIRWARKDIEIRNNFSTQSVLAWALHVGGDHGEALHWMQRALQSGVLDAHLFSNAAMIYKAAGHHETGHLYHRRALELNPRLGGFHTHHH